MAEAIIRKKRSGKTYKLQLITNIITTNKTFIVPEAVNQSFDVRIFGGGASGYYAGGGYSTGGGGGGWMNNGEFQIPNNTFIQITVGEGGQFSNNFPIGKSGGTTSFGSYISANGGDGGSDAYHGGSGGSGGYIEVMCPIDYRAGNVFYQSSYGGTGYQFGGGYAIGSGAVNAYGGDGGIWGGGGGAMSTLGGVVSFPNTSSIRYQEAKGGNGGMYGGGGGAFGSFYFRTDYNNVSGGMGGIYGGNGGWSMNKGGQNNNFRYSLAKSGTDTIGNSEVPNDCQGPGNTSLLNTFLLHYHGGGGGGYGGKGGWDGGGGYGGSGGCGGGGYGNNANGGEYTEANNLGTLTGGGGGYFSRGGFGGGSYGNGANYNSGPGYGGGGSPYNDRGYGDGGNGIVLVQYYA